MIELCHFLKGLNLFLENTGFVIAINIVCFQNSVFVRAIRNYLTNENELLSFAKGDIIKLTNRDLELEQGNGY